MESVNFPDLDALDAAGDEGSPDLAAGSAGLFTRDWPENFRAGFAAVIGRPNVGKSTLINAMVGRKIAITSARPETTRRVVRGIVHRPDFQLILVDTPGIHRPRTLLGQRLNDMVEDAFSEVDVAVFCVPADQPIGPGDRRIVDTQLKTAHFPAIAVVTKTDVASREQVAEQLLAVSQLYDFAEIVPISARQGTQVQTLIDLLGQRLPLSPPLYPRDQVTDEDDTAMISELIREAALESLSQELPHSLAVQVEEIIKQPGRSGDGEIWKIHVNLFVERDSQKAIIIGRKGSRLKEIGTQARPEIEALVGHHVYLDLHVRTAKEWQRNPKMLNRLGF